MLNFNYSWKHEPMPDSHVAVGLTYILFTMFAIPANCLCILAILINKLLDRPTYFFILNECLADLFGLLTIGLYTGIRLLVTFDCPACDQVATFSLHMGWFPSGYFALMICLTRMFALKYVVHYKVIFSRIRLHIIAALIWTAMLCFSTACAMHEPSFGAVYVHLYTFRMQIVDKWGVILAYYNLTQDIICSFGSFVINLLALGYLRKSIVQVSTVGTQVQSRKLEVKLFAQCLVTTTLMTTLCALYVMTFFVNYAMNPRHFLISHITWLLFHVACPCIYLSTNGDMRQMATQFLCRVGCCRRACVRGRRSRSLTHPCVPPCT